MGYMKYKDPSGKYCECWSDELLIIARMSLLKECPQCKKPINKKSIPIYFKRVLKAESVSEIVRITYECAGGHRWFVRPRDEPDILPSLCPHCLTEYIEMLKKSNERK